MGLIQAKAQIIALELLIQSVAESSDKWAENKVIRRPDGTFLRWDNSSGDVTGRYKKISEGQARKSEEITSDDEYKALQDSIATKTEKLGDYQDLLDQSGKSSSAMKSEMEDNIQKLVTNIAALSLQKDQAELIYNADNELTKKRQEQLKKKQEEILEERENKKIDSMSPEDKLKYLRQKQEAKDIKDSEKKIRDFLEQKEGLFAPFPLFKTINEFSTPILREISMPTPDESASDKSYIISHAAIAATAFGILAVATNRRKMLGFIENNFIKPHKAFSVEMDDIGSVLYSSFKEHIAEVEQSAKKGLAEPTAQHEDFIATIQKKITDFTEQSKQNTTNFRNSDGSATLKGYEDQESLVNYHNLVSNSFTEMSKDIADIASDTKLSAKDRLTEIIDAVKDAKGIKMKSIASDFDEIPTILDKIIDEKKQIPLLGFFLRQHRKVLKESGAKTASVLDKPKANVAKALSIGDEEGIREAKKNLEKIKKLNSEGLSEAEKRALEIDAKKTASASRRQTGKAADKIRSSINKKTSQIAKAETKLADIKLGKATLEDDIDRLKKAKDSLWKKKIIDGLSFFIKKTNSGKSTSDQLVEVEQALSNAAGELEKNKRMSEEIRSKLVTLNKEKGLLEANLEKTVKSAEDVFADVDADQLPNWVAKSSLPEPIVNAFATILRASKEEPSLETSICLQMIARGDTSIGSDIVSLLKEMDIKITPEIIAESQELKKDPQMLKQLKIELISSM
jgi:hypothetical protein